MAFPTAQAPLDTALDNIVNAAARLKGTVQALRDQSAAGDTDRKSYVALLVRIRDAIQVWDQAAATPGLVQYARDQFDDQGLDIVAEYNTMRSATVALRNWIFANIPVDVGSGAVLLYSLSNDGTITSLKFTSAQTAGFRTEADAFLATIN